MSGCIHGSCSGASLVNLQTQQALQVVLLCVSFSVVAVIEFFMNQIE
ncbi:hypothetical protein [Rubritalea tangerina]